jgi:thiosulfate/3-mercaptopyruvate sulfurtransferase
MESAVNDNNILTSVETLRCILNNDDIRIVDCRFSLNEPDAGLQQYRNSHIPGAVFADLDKDMAAPVQSGTGRHPLPNPVTFATCLGRLGISEKTRVVAYDQASGALAARFWWLLRWLGHENVSLLDGGMARWLESGLPVESGPVDVEAAVFNAKPNMALVLTTDDIIAAGDNREHLQLVDARDTERFDGIKELIDPVAGHIPGTLNVPYSESLKENGTWKSAEELRTLWEGVLGQGIGSSWSVMCGSGVTACHLVASGLRAGLPEPRVYVGSWSEWITDPARAVGSRESGEG